MNLMREMRKFGNHIVGSFVYTVINLPKPESITSYRFLLLGRFGQKWVRNDPESSVAAGHIFEVVLLET
jgi:hypothetical protein